MTRQPPTADDDRRERQETLVQIEGPDGPRPAGDTTIDTRTPDLSPASDEALRQLARLLGRHAARDRSDNTARTDDLKDEDHADA